MTPHDVVTIVFEEEIDLLRLQARSMARYLPDALVGEIVVVDNGRRPMPAATARRLLSDYGPLAPKVSIRRAAEICRVPVTKGWRSQQVQKLAIADQLSALRYLVLDAKTHLVYPLEPSFLESADGRPTVNVYSYVDHPLRDVLIEVLRYLDVDPARYLDRFTATVTPFVFDRAIVQDMMRGIEARSGRSFAQEFVRRELTEFFLYAGWIARTGREPTEVHYAHQRFCKIIWGHWRDTAECRATIAEAAASGEPFFSVHRRAIARFGAAEIDAVAAFWTERALFETEGEARAFLRDFQAMLARRARFARVRALPAQVATVLRRGARRIIR